MTTDSSVPAPDTGAAPTRPAFAATGLIAATALALGRMRRRDPSRIHPRPATPVARAPDEPNLD